MTQRDTAVNAVVSCVAVILVCTILAACGKADHYLYIAKNQTMKNMFCDCPAGFSPTSDFLKCSRESVVAPSKPSNPSPIVRGDDDGQSYYTSALFLADADGNSNWPFQTKGKYFDGTHPYVVDSTKSLLAFNGIQLSDPAFSFWRSRVVGNNRVSIQGANDNQWYTKTFCIDLPNPKNYLIHVGADNNYRVKIDGKEFADCTTSDTCFSSAILYNQSFSAGKHLVELKYVNLGAQGAVWFEVFDNTFNDAKNARRDSDLNVVYSSKSLLGDFWDYTNEICPDGYAYDVCSKDKKCSKLEYQDCR